MKFLTALAVVFALSTFVVIGNPASAESRELRFRGTVAQDQPALGSLPALSAGTVLELYGLVDLSYPETDEPTSDNETAYSGALTGLTLTTGNHRQVFPTPFLLLGNSADVAGATADYWTFGLREVERSLGATFLLEPKPENGSGANLHVALNSRTVLAKDFYFGDADSLVRLSQVEVEILESVLFEDHFQEQDVGLWTGCEGCP